MINKFMVDNQAELQSFIDFINDHAEFEGSQFWHELNDIFWEIEETINNMRDEKTVIENNLEGAVEDMEVLEQEFAALKEEYEALKERVSE